MGYRSDGYVGYAKVFMYNDKPNLDNELYIKTLYNDQNPEDQASEFYYTKSNLVKDIEPCGPLKEKLDVSKLETGTVIRVLGEVLEKNRWGNWDVTGDYGTQKSENVQALVDSDHVMVLFDPRDGDADLTGQIF
jgi:hypothetical protein